MRQIPLTKGQVALIDDEDFDRVSQFKWHAIKRRGEGNFHAARRVFVPGDKSYIQYMHTFLMELPLGSKLQVHHLNGDGLDNRRSNLRVVTNAENHRSFRRLNKNNTSGIRGVGKLCNGKYSSMLMHAGKEINCGTFLTQEDAARARDAAARRLGWPEDGMCYPIESPAMR